MAKQRSSVASVSESRPKDPGPKLAFGEKVFANSSLLIKVNSLIPIMELAFLCVLKFIVFL